ncbi:MAG TPA: YHS domain-containing protein [Pirellulales bacterium]|nr:YHS domain-containing protein [Pirellulales bacterium]
MAQDPVCGMEVKPENAVAKADYGGKTYHFCSVDCQRQFKDNPEKFVKQHAQSK